jgi:predicted Zn-dependent protease with MMP-like domain
MVDVPPERFEELVGEALDSIPESLGRYMENVGVFVEDQRHPNLLGLYQGIPLTHRAAYGAPYNGLPMPDRITIFRLPTLDFCEDRDDVVEEVAVTVVHEIAHHFGIDDERLHALGWG